MILLPLQKNDERTTYNMIYSDGPKGVTFIKRFNVTGITREKEYDLTKGTPNSAVHWFTINPNGEAEKVQVILKPVPGLRKFELDIDFAEIPVKGRSSTGNIVTKYAIKKVLLKTKGASTLAAEDYWFNDTVHRLNKDSKGTYLGKFAGDDKILTVTSKGFYKLYTYDVLNHFDDDIILIEKYYTEQVLSCIYYDGESKSYITKRFIPENTSTKTLIITENENSRIELITSQILPIVDIKFNKEKDKVIADEAVNLVEFAPMVNMKAKGKKLTSYKVKEINLRVSEEIVHEDYTEEDEEIGGNGMSPMELHRKAMEKLNGDNMRGEDGQINFDF
jgi:topoisomerase-4 subunit A